MYKHPAVPSYRTLLDSFFDILSALWQLSYSLSSFGRIDFARSCALRRYVGLWQTNVLALNLVAPPRLRQEPAKPTINFLFGDDSSARTQVDVPYNQRSVVLRCIMYAGRLWS